MKKLLCLLLAIVILATMFTAVPFSASATALGEYTPKEGTETKRVYFAIPGEWVNDTTKSQDNACGIYWWGTDDDPDEAPEANGHGWPGWKMKNGDFSNLRCLDIPCDVRNVIFNNYIDFGIDTPYPEYAALQQTNNLQIEYFGEGDSDYYPLEFWDYLYDDYYEDFCDNTNYMIEEFGVYAKNFFIDDYDNIFHNIDNMVYVVDLNPMNMMMSPITGKAGYSGAFYFYYDNGEFGIWPTREMCIEKEELTVDKNGEVVFDGETVDDKTGFILREHTDAYNRAIKRDFVVFGNFTGKYWETGSAHGEATSDEPCTTTEPATQDNPTEPDEPDDLDKYGFVIGSYYYMGTNNGKDNMKLSQVSTDTYTVSIYLAKGEEIEISKYIGNGEFDEIWSFDEIDSGNYDIELEVHENGFGMQSGQICLIKDGLPYRSVGFATSSSFGTNADIGDANEDGVVDILDAALIQKYVVEKTDFNIVELYLADVNDDGVVDILDATEIQKFAVEKITEFKKSQGS